MSFISELIGDRLNTVAIPARTSSDPLDKLPPAQRDKLVRLDDERDALHGAIPTDRLRSLFEALNDVQGQRSRFTSAPGFKTTPGGAERVESEYDIRIDKIQSEIKRLKVLNEEASDAWNLHGNVVTKCFDFLESSRGELKAARLPKPKLNDGEGHHQAVERVRASLNQLRQDRERVELAPVPASQLAHEAVAALDAMSAVGVPDFDPRIRGRDPFKLDLHLTRPNVGIAFLLFMFRDEIAERLTAIVGPQIEGALTDADRAKQISSIDEQYLEMERVEEALIVEAAEVGMRIRRRIDADPRAILEVE